MIELASGRLPHGVAFGDATGLPIASARADAVVLIWLLHLLADTAPVLAEGARVLRDGGVLVTTVDKDEAAFSVDSDIAAITAPVRRKYATMAADHFDRVVELAARHGLRPVSEASFAGIGQGRSPRQWRERIIAGSFPWSREADPAEVADLCQDLSTLPGQEIARPDPHYRLIALSCHETGSVDRSAGGRGQVPEDDPAPARLCRFTCPRVGLTCLVYSHIWSSGARRSRVSVPWCGAAPE